jgi:hypothetical protein
MEGSRMAKPNHFSGRCDRPAGCNHGEAGEHNEPEETHMTFRNQMLAGLIAILGAPAVTLAASSGPTWYDIQNNPALRQRYANVQNGASTEASATTPKDFDLKHDQAMRQGADHNAANATAVGKSESAGPSAEATKAWSLKHWKAMQQGADHQKASVDASKG